MGAKKTKKAAPKRATAKKAKAARPAPGVRAKARAKAPAKKAPAKKAPAKKARAKVAKARPAPARGPTPRVSPLRGMPVDEWVQAKVTGWQADVVARLLALAGRVAPEATVSIKWGQPVFELSGPFAFIKPARAHVTFGFWRGAELTDPARVLLEGGSRMQHYKVTSPDELDELGLAALVQEAVALNRSKGDPSRR